MGSWAARVGDMHVCLMIAPGVWHIGLPLILFPPGVPHAGGPLLPPGEPTVLIGGMPAARVGDMAACVGASSTVVSGSGTVKIGGMPAARLGDATGHGGIAYGGILDGHPRVLIGG